MGGKDVRVVATDGDHFEEMAVINHTYETNVKRIVAGFVSDGEGDMHTTYHEEGYIHRKMKAGGETRTHSEIQGPPLEEFKGFVSLHTSTVSTDLSKVGSKEFDFGQYDDIVYVDSRNSEMGMYYRPYIVQRGYPFIQELERDARGDIDECKVGLHFTPSENIYISIIYYPQLVDPSLPTHTSNFDYLYIPEDYK